MHFLRQIQPFYLRANHLAITDRAPDLDINLINNYWGILQTCSLDDLCLCVKYRILLSVMFEGDVVFIRYIKIAINRTSSTGRAGPVHCRMIARAWALPQSSWPPLSSRPGGGLELHSLPAMWSLYSDSLIGNTQGLTRCWDILNCTLSLYLFLWSIHCWHGSTLNSKQRQDPSLQYLS